MQITQPAITCSKLTIKTAERCHQLRSGVFIVNFEHIFTPCSSVFIVNFEQVNAGWEADGWLHFIKWFSTNSRIEQAFITQTFLETRNWKIKSKAVHPSYFLFGKCLQKNVKGIRELFFSFHGHLLDPQHGAPQVVLFKVCDKDACKMHFRCVLRCLCAIVHLSLPSLYLERYAVFKIWSSV